MATEKALFTTQADFEQEQGIGVSVDPLFSYDGDDHTGWSLTGTPGTVPGVKGNAETFVTAYAQRTMTLNPGTHVFSLWIKPTASDMTNWRILFSNRGASQSNRGFHLAMYNQQLDFRVYDLNESVLDMYSNDADQLPGARYIQADHLYHIIVYFVDSTSTSVWVNDVTEGTIGWERWLYSTFPMNLSTNLAQKITIGDMPTGTTKAYAYNGWIDEFMYWTNVGGAMIPTVNELQTTYHDYILDAKWIDFTSEPGSMKLAQAYDGTYTQTKMSWTSPSIDLGAEGFGDFGRVQLNYLAPTGTGIDLWTSASSDGSTWDAWIKVAQDGTINSADKRYIKVKVDFWTTLDTATPVIQEIQILDYPKKKRLSLVHEPLIIYNDKATGLERVGELVNAYDIFITEEIIDAEGGEETIEWKMALNDPKRIELGSEPVEKIARIGDKQFIIKNPVDQRDESGKKYTQFNGEALWYELRDFKIISFEKIEVIAQDMIQGILDSTIEPHDWTILKIDPALATIKRTIRGDWKSVLELLLEVCDQYGGELEFDTINKTISLVVKIGEDNGVRFYYNKNLKTIERSVDTYNLVTRLYLYGKNDMTVKSVHPNGLEYVENLDWVGPNGLNLRNQIRVDRFKDERYTIPQNLYDVGIKMINDLSKPNVSYAMKVNDLSILSGHEHEMIGIGDVVYAIDTELLNLVVDSRIVRRKYNVRQPWNSDVELNQPKKTLADANQRNIDENLEILAQSDPLDTNDVQQMTVFNHLLNSRAEDGKVYWEESGTGITVEIGGFSGDASWKFDTGYGDTNSLKQSIFGVSHRSAYTVSAYVYNEGTITRGVSQDAFVGIKVTIHYTTPDADGNTFEEHFLAIPDITQQ